MEILFIIALVPFCIPLLLLTVISLKTTKPVWIVSFSQRFLTLSPGIWFLLPLVAIGFRNRFANPTTGIALTLLIPNVAFFIAYLPDFVLLHSSKQRVALNGILAVLSTFVFWNLTVSSANWREGALAFAFILPATIGMVVMTSSLLNFRMKANIGRFSKKVGVGLSVLCLAIVFKAYKDDFAGREAMSKLQLVKAVANFLAEQGPDKFNQKSFIKLGYLNGIYETKEEVIINKYGGTVSMTLTGDTVSISYTNIPAKEPCYVMYFVNNPEMYGFDETYVSGVKVPHFSNTIQIEKTKRKLCFETSESKTIEFRGRVEKIIKKKIVEDRFKEPNQNMPFSDPETAEKVFYHFSQLAKPGTNSNEFEHWTYNTAGFAAIECWQELNARIPVPESLTRLQPTKAGVWASRPAEEISRFCKSLAKHGIKPICTNAVVWAKDVKRRRGLPVDYVQVYQATPLQIEGSINCFLTPDQINKQSYTGDISAYWSEQPRLQSFNLADGPQQLEAGTLMISAPHVPGLNGTEFQEPKIAVVISKEE